MSKEVFYKQCELVQVGEFATRRHVAYIPERFADLGHKVDIDGYEGTWTVVSVYPRRLSENAISVESSLYRKQRKASDI